MEEKTDLNLDGLEGLRDGSLFELIAKQDEQSEPAFDVLYERYKKDFFRLIWRFGSEDVVKEIFNETFETAYLKAKTFKPCDDLDSEAERRRTLKWLCKIAGNVSVQKFRKQGKEVQIFTEDKLISKGQLFQKIREGEEEILGLNRQKGKSNSLEEQILKQVLSELSERDKDILLTYVKEVDLKVKSQKISRATMKELKERYGLKPANIRQIKLRTLKVVQSRLLSRMRVK